MTRRTEFNPTARDVDDLIELGESETIELKSTTPSESEIARVLVSFANTRGGILIVGADEREHGDERLIGLTEGDLARALNRLTAIKSALPVSGGWGATEVRGRNVAYAWVEPASDHVKPVTTADGTAYERRGTSSLAIRPEPRAKTTQPTGQLEPRRGEIKLFVAMSFRSEEEPALVDYFRAIERAVARADTSITIIRMDLEEGDFEISQELLDRIQAADIVIADFTLSSQNVYFELGVARGLKKRVIQCARVETPLQFDVRNWRTTQYRNATELEEKLVPAIEAAVRDVFG